MYTSFILLHRLQAGAEDFIITMRFSGVYAKSAPDLKSLRKCHMQMAMTIASKNRLIHIKHSYNTPKTID